ncbi:hypothetical protein M3J09_004885 [Ascochyta lentis]
MLVNSSKHLIGALLLAPSRNFIDRQISNAHPRLN